MSDAAVDSPSDRLQLDSISVIDLRLFSQSELYDLSRCSDAAFDPRRCDDVVVPKIDRSVFNESAGSRKQTFSRLRLAPRKPESPAQASINPNHVPNIRALNSDPERAENSQIVALLKQLFCPTHNGDELVPIPVEYSNSAPQLPNQVNVVQKRKRGRPRKNESLAVVPVEVRAQDVIKDIVVYDANVEQREKEIVNRNGGFVDLAALASLEDPYGFEVRRRTEGLKSEDELLGFLGGLSGQWGSRRKKKRIVDASEFGDALPEGWKIMLSLKRKEGRVWIFVRRYISPNGQQFVTCKEVSSYLSFQLQDVNQPKFGQSIKNVQLTCKIDGGNSADPAAKEVNQRADLVYSSPSAIMHVSNDHEKIVTSDMGSSMDIQTEEVLKCEKCAMSFDKKDDLLQHKLSSHRRKRSRFGTSITDGVIIKDGQYECQFCHKTFTERNRYNGHVGAHKRHHMKSDEALVGVVNMENMVGSASSSEVKESTMQASMDDTDSVICNVESNSGQKIVSPPSNEASVGILSEPNSIGPVSASVFPPKESTVQSSFRNDNNAVMSNVKVDNDLKPVSPQRNFVCGLNIGSHAEKSDNEINFLSGDVDSRSCKNEVKFAEDFCFKHDENNKINNCWEMVDKASKEVIAKSNVCLTYGVLSGNSTDGAANIMKCTENRTNNTSVEPGRSTASYLPSTSPDEKPIGNPDNVHSASPLERLELCVPDTNISHDFSNAAAPLLSDVTAVKQQSSSEGYATVPVDNDQQSGSSNYVKVGLTSLCEESKQKRVSESIDEEDQGVKNNADRASSTSVFRLELSEIYNKANNDVIVACGSDFSGRDEVVVTGVEQKTGESSMLLSSSKEPLNDIADNGSASTAFKEKELRQERCSESNLFISSVHKQNCNVKTDMTDVCNRKIKQPSHNEVQSYKSNEVTLGIGPNQLNTSEGDFEISPQVLSGGESISSVKENEAKLHDNMEETPKLASSFDSDLLISCMGKSFGDSDSKDRASTNSFRVPKPDEGKNTGSSELILDFGNSSAGMVADVINSVPIEQTFSFGSNLTGENSRTMKDQKQGSGFVGHSCFAESCDDENNFNMVHNGRVWEVPLTNEVQTSGLPDSGYLTHNMWRSGGENILRSPLASTFTQQDQSSSCFPTLNGVSDKDKLELLGTNRKNDAMPGFEGSQPGQSKHVELGFLTTQNMIPLPQDSKSLSYDTGIGQGFDSPFWLGKDALSLNIAARNLVTTVCLWCRNEFQYEPPHSETQTGAIGTVCQTCRAKVSEQFNFF